MTKTQSIRTLVLECLAEQFDGQILWFDNVMEVISNDEQRSLGTCVTIAQSAVHGRLLQVGCKETAASNERMDRRQMWSDGSKLSSCTVKRQVGGRQAMKDLLLFHDHWGRGPMAR